MLRNISIRQRHKLIDRLEMDLKFYERKYHQFKQKAIETKNQLEELEKEW